MGRAWHLAHHICYDAASLKADLTGFRRRCLSSDLELTQAGPNPTTV